MNFDDYKKQLIEFASAVTHVNRKNNFEDFLDENFETYLNATVKERNEIRQIIKDHNISEKDIREGESLPMPLRYLLNWYGIRSIKQLETTGDDIWLTRGLVAISILDGIHYRPDDEEHLARLYVAAEEKGIDPNPVFQGISKISNNELTKPKQISTSELIANTHIRAHEIVDELRKWFTVDKEKE